MRRKLLFAVGSVLGLALLAALTAAAVLLSTSFVVAYARTPAAAQAGR